MKNESNTYDKPLNTVAEWGQKFNATVNTFNSKNDLFSEWTEKMLIQLPCKQLPVKQYQCKAEIHLCSSKGFRIIRNRNYNKWAGSE